MSLPKNELLLYDEFANRGNLMNGLRFFNPYSDIRKTSNRLPHWQQQGAVYFITFRLADAVPESLRSQWENDRSVWIRLHPMPWNSEIEKEYHTRFSGAIERWLDAGHGSCVLRRSDCAAVIAEVLRYFDADRYTQITSVIMPNHVHTSFVQNPNWPLEKILRSWKSFTARKINALLKRCDSLWQRDYFDRLVRDERHLRNCIRYIRRNPQKAKLAAGEYVLHENELARSID